MLQWFIQWQNKKQTNENHIYALETKKIGKIYAAVPSFLTFIRVQLLHSSVALK